MEFKDALPVISKPPIILVKAEKETELSIALFLTSSSLIYEIPEMLTLVKLALSEIVK